MESVKRESPWKNMFEELEDIDVEYDDLTPSIRADLYGKASTKTTEENTPTIETATRGRNDQPSRMKFTDTIYIWANGIYKKILSIIKTTTGQLLGLSMINMIAVDLCIKGIISAEITLGVAIVVLISSVCIYSNGRRDSSSW